MEDKYNRFHPRNVSHSPSRTSQTQKRLVQSNAEIKNIGNIGQNDRFHPMNIPHTKVSQSPRKQPEPKRETGMPHPHIIQTSSGRSGCDFEKAHTTTPMKRTYSPLPTDCNDAGQAACPPKKPRIARVTKKNEKEEIRLLSLKKKEEALKKKEEALKKKEAALKKKVEAFKKKETLKMERTLKKAEALKKKEALKLERALKKEKTMLRKKTIIKKEEQPLHADISDEDLNNPRPAFIKKEVADTTMIVKQEIIQTAVAVKQEAAYTTETVKQEVVNTTEAAKQEIAGIPGTSKQGREQSPLTSTSKPSNSKKKTQNVDDINCLKAPSDLREEVIKFVSDSLDHDPRVKPIISLLEDDFTIPFIARYRQHAIGVASVDFIRKVKARYESGIMVATRRKMIVEKLKVAGVYNDRLKKLLYSAKDVHELDIIYEPYKVSRASKAEDGKKLGLLPYALELLEGRDPPVNSLIGSRPEINTLSALYSYMVPLLTTLMFRDVQVTGVLYNLISDPSLKIDTTAIKNPKQKTTKTSKKLECDVSKFEKYLAFSQSVKYLKPHQVLAINRAELSGFIKVEIVSPAIQNKLLDVSQKWSSKRYSKENYDFLCGSIEKLLVKGKRFVNTHVRNLITEKAVTASAAVFSKNLRWLLLTPPVRGKTVLAIDPGYKKSKFAVLSPSMEILHTQISYFHPGRDQRETEKAFNCIAGIVRQFNVEVVGIGDGQASRLLERIVSDVINSSSLRHKNVLYSIIPEQGVSIYSCSPDATNEYPHLDPLLISAVSLGRRLQDPLGEYVKVNPRNLGIGMYQLDLDHKCLASALKDVVVEAVSLVGVDVNTASVQLLSHIAGLTVKKAEALIEWRNARPFLNRQDVLKVPGIGVKTYEQCAGFLRIFPETINADEREKRLCNPLDTTDIHPEAYSTTEKFLRVLGLRKEDACQPSSIDIVKEWCSINDLSSTAQKLKVGVDNLSYIVDILKKTRTDPRENFPPPLMSEKYLTMKDLREGQSLIGKVSNVTDFGVFVNLRVERDGLIPLQSGLYKLDDIHWGQRVRVQIMHIESASSKITLKFLGVEEY